MLVFLLMYLSCTLYSQLKLARQSINNRYTYTVQATRDFITVIIKLAARMQNCQDYLCSRDTLFRMDIGWNTPAIVRYAHRFIFMNGHQNFITVSSQCFINRVIDHLEYHMVQPCPIVCITNIHTRTFTHCV